ncbi:hypothetical protein MKW98_017158 [Papaver atlanticum]|uniref:RING-type E3 ubiquitin transferase n=1 Tax=Papaver atlanticum TaxID=357466 RepID=A0AAD4XBD4_9MAGN|nr:hypothetical protein MKW98_017158 [Papaver atlanticum]
MGAFIIILPLFILFFLCYPHFIVSTKNCWNNQCSKGEPRISYPFRIKGRQEKACGFRGFDLSCDNMSRTVIDLPFSGRFLVDKINYDSNYNEIQLRDPNNCLTRRFLNHLNLFGTPFVGINFTDYSFFNCSSNDSNYFPVSSTSISCLSSSTHSVIAISPNSWTYNRDSMRNCMLIATLQVPVVSYNSFFSPFLFPHESTTLHLTWEWQELNCKGNCNGSTNGDQIDARNFLISIGIIFLILFVLVKYCLFRRDANSQTRDVSSRVVQTTTLPVINTTSLSGAAIQSFPMVVVGESGRLPNPDINTCAICLSEYKPKETLKSFPACNHCFHADCIDVWLHLKSSCPVCRKSLVSSND